MNLFIKLSEALNNGWNWNIEILKHCKDTWFDCRLLLGWKYIHTYTQLFVKTFHLKLHTLQISRKNEKLSKASNIYVHTRHTMNKLCANYCKFIDKLAIFFYGNTFFPEYFFLYVCLAIHDQIAFSPMHLVNACLSEAKLFGKSIGIFIGAIILFYPNIIFIPITYCIGPKNFLLVQTIKICSNRLAFQFPIYQFSGVRV